MIKIQDISHVVFKAPDLKRMNAFLTDFGFTSAEIDGKLYARGLGPAPYLHVTEIGEPGFAAVGFRAASMDDLEQLASAEGVKTQSVDRPGGGKMISLRDPDGHVVEVIAGQTNAEQLKLPAETAWNDARQKRRSRQPKRTGSDSSHVVRLGHCVLGVTDFRRSEQWYKERFGFITSDEIQFAPQMSIGAFLRCDRGATPTDHHTLFLLQASDGARFHHAAFEVVDLDDLFAGHERLKRGGWNPEWGIGRHLLGSQVFDYWRDPWGHTLEHWTDGDLFTADDGSKVASLAELLAVQWGMPAPAPGSK